MLENELGSKYRYRGKGGLCPPKYECCGKFFYTFDELRKHVESSHPEVYRRDFVPYVSRMEKKANYDREKEKAEKARQRPRKSRYDGGVFFCSKCKTHHSEGWILHYPKEVGGDRIMCCSCANEIYRPRIINKLIYTPMGGKTR